MNPNPFVRDLGKPAEKFTRADILRFIRERDVPMLNLRYVGDNGRLKTLNFAIQSVVYLERMLTMGERMDGSSLFDFIDVVGSDLYVVSQLRTTSLNPFNPISSLDIMYGFYDVNGDPLASAPQQVLHKAQDALEGAMGCRPEAFDELEYYLFSAEESLFPVEPQRGCHEASPFSKWEEVRTEAFYHLAQMGCSVKHTYAEAGNSVADGVQAVQQKIEFSSVDVVRAAGQMVLVKQVVCEMVHSHGIGASFSPKTVTGRVGFGMYFRMRLVKDGINQSSEGTGSTDAA